MKYTNPIIPGFYPDPSICKHEDTYYMVHSTFQYFPGVTLFESKDLINWSQIGHVLTRNSQLPLAGSGSSGGIFAPTIRCNEGRFYMVTTNVTASFGNFYVWTDDIYGEWSEPILVDQGGIDPSLYFEDGKCYFMSNGNDDEGHPAIIQCEIDIETGKKLTPSQHIWNGDGGRYLEAPHLYKINNKYYIIAAEGGTEYGHMVICARGDTPYGSFESCPKNPILTNRDLGGYEIQACGHGDLVEDDKGDWWMVHLAFRQIGQWDMFHLTGRETYLVPANIDDDGWISLGVDGITPLEIETDRLSDDIIQKKRSLYTFENTKQGVEWCFIRNPYLENYKFNKDSYELTATSKKLFDENDSPTFTAIRQCEMYGHVSCNVSVAEQEAGLTLYMDNLHHYDFYIKRTEDKTIIEKRICIGDIIYLQESYVLDSYFGENVNLKIRFTPYTYFFEASINGEILDFGHNQTRYLSTEVAQGFTGVMIGLFAQSDKTDYTKPAVFSDFRCEFKD